MADSGGTSKRPLDHQAISSSLVFKKPRAPDLHDQQTFATVAEGGGGEGSSSKPAHRRPVGFQSLDAYTRHKLLVNYYQLTYPGQARQTMARDRSRDKTDFEVLLENHRFVWSEEDLNSATLTWGQRVAKKYYDKLFKEYCIIDLTRYKENRFGMRWRSEAEVLSGKGQFSCGSKHCSAAGMNLTSWEVKFAYEEQGEKKLTFIKVRLCTFCSDKLNYVSVKRKAPKKTSKSKRFKKLQKELEHAHRDSAGADNASTGIQIKEEILTDAEDENPARTNRPSSSSAAATGAAPNPLADQNYQDLIDQIWRQPVKLEPEETETTLEEEVDDYLNLLFE